MGAYVNPSGMTKEQWLARNGEIVLDRFPTQVDERGKDYLPVCLVKNQFFSAAGIAYNERELRDFSDPFDQRPKVWFWVEKSKLLGVSDLASYLQE